MGGFSARDDWPGVVALVNINVVIASAGRIGATDNNARLEPSPVSWRAG